MVRKWQKMAKKMTLKISDKKKKTKKNLIIILVINVGSSSIKYAVYQKKETQKELQNLKKVLEDNMQGLFHKKDHVKALNRILENLKEKNLWPDLIGHRVVHGDDIKNPKIIDAELLRKLKKITELAPLHLIPEVRVIEELEKTKIMQVAVFDTSFHSEMPEKARVYGIPYKYYEQGIKRYGFHGISYKYISEHLKHLKYEKMIICHLGNGCSMCAVENGKSKDTTMGFTPLEGLIMGTRSGNIDPAIIPYLLEKGQTLEEVKKMLNHESGVLGISGKTYHLGKLLKKKDARSKLAIDVFCYTTAKHLGSMITAIDGVDAIIFTAGIGENNPEIRTKILANFQYLGVKIDESKNKTNNEIFHAVNSKIKLYKVKTDEELVIAEETLRVCQSSR